MSNRKVLTAVSLLVAILLAATGWFVTQTLERLADLERENETLRSRVSDLEGPRRDELVSAVGEILGDTGARLTQLERDYQRLDDILFDFGPSFTSPSIDDLDRRLDTLERRVDSACVALLVQVGVVPAC